MPEAFVNGVHLQYETVGSGPLLVWTEGGRFGRTPQSALARHFADRYTVLRWDRRNAAGASEIALSDDDWYVITDAEDLAALIRHLDLGAAHLAGTSAGASASMLVAARYPELTRSLILLQPPTDDRSMASPFADAWQELADVAREHGLQGVIDHSQSAWDREREGERLDSHTWPAESIHLNPANRDRLLAMDVKRFVSTMERWAASVRNLTWPPGLSEEDLQQLTCPGMVVPGRDAIHPHRVAERLVSLIPNAQLAELPSDVDRASSGKRLASLFPQIDAFLEQSQNG